MHKGHGEFLKRSSQVLADVLEAALPKTSPSRDPLVVKLAVLVATGRPIETLHGMAAGYWRDVIWADRDLLPDYTLQDWKWVAKGSRFSTPEAGARLYRLFATIGDRPDYPALDKMAAWGRHKLANFFSEVADEEAMAWTFMANLVDRRVLPAGGELGRVIRRIGFLNGDEVPDDRVALPTAVEKLKWYIPRLASSYCHEALEPGGDECGECPASWFCLAQREAKDDDERADGYRFVDAFAGGGGLSQGLTMSGLRLSAAIEIDDYAADTLYANHPEAGHGFIYRKDIRKLVGDPDFISKYKGVDIVVGGPPCQPFSMARRHSQADMKDPRKNLFKSFTRMIEELEPMMVVMENVPGILTAGKGATIKAIKDEFHRIGYEVEFKVLNAEDYGVPQKRRRVFFLAADSAYFEDAREVVDYAFKSLNRRKKGEPVTLKQALSGLPVLNPGEGGNAVPNDLRGRRSRYATGMRPINKLVLNHQARDHNADDLEIFSELLPGETASQYAQRKPANKIKYQLESFGDKYRKLDLSKPSPTIPAHLRRDANSFVNPKSNIGLTPREAARIQGFPDDYLFLGGFGPAFVQIGNAIPPPLAKAVGESVKSALDRFA